MRVLLIADEVYPVYEPERVGEGVAFPIVGGVDAVVDVPEETVWKWESACSEWEAAQKEMLAAVAEARKS